MKKKAQSEEGVFIDGVESSPVGILFEIGGEKLKDFVEHEGRISKELKDSYLKKEIGEYIDAKQIRKITQIKSDSLVSAANKGIIQGIRLKRKWYYSLESVQQAIKKGLI
jgi:hypothetical protein